MNDEEALAPLRNAGVKVLLAALWVQCLALIPIGWFTHANDGGNVLPALLIGAVVLLFPTAAWFQQRGDTAVRTMLGIACAVYPALMVFLFQDHPWQMDLHMYFFVCMAALLPLCDWRPIVACTLITAAHHLVLLGVHPDWVFPGSGSIGRVMVHAVLVVAEAAILIFAGRRIIHLTKSNAATAHEAHTAHAEAEQARAATQETLEQLRGAQQAADRARAEQAAAETALAQRASGRRADAANAINDGIGAIATDLQGAAHSLIDEGTGLAQVSSTLHTHAGGLREASEKSVHTISSMARSSEELTRSIRVIGSSAQDAQRIAEGASDTVETLAPRIQALTGEIHAARDILELVSAIAAQSNLLALNATIEAARSGDAGRGFGVVAHEMKAMAARTSQAASEIAAKLEGIGGAADAFVQAIETTTGRIGAIRESTVAIADAVRNQHSATEAITASAEAVMRHVLDTDAKSRAISDAAGENRAIAERTSALARQLDTRANALSDGMNALLGDIRAA